MKTAAIISLALVALSFSVPAQAQSDTIPTPDFPQGYEKWDTRSRKRTFRPGLVIETTQYRTEDKEVVIARINNDNVFSYLLEGSNGLRYQRVSLFWLSPNGYIYVKASSTDPGKQEENRVGRIWLDWIRYVKAKHNISDQEMDELPSYLEF